jgi:hypothetical protein
MTAHPYPLWNIGAESKVSYQGLLGHYIMHYQRFFVFMQAVIPPKLRAQVYYTIEYPNSED